MAEDVDKLVQDIAESSNMSAEDSKKLQKLAYLWLGYGEGLSSPSPKGGA
jgi:hypothetical protein